MACMTSDRFVLNWQFKKQSAMKFKELDKINGESDFSAILTLRLQSMLMWLTVGGSLLVLAWQFVDTFFMPDDESKLLWLRLITVVAYGINFWIAWLRKSAQASKQHLVAGFYLGTVFCMMLTVYSGANQSPYWFGLFFILIGWFVLVPFTYRELMAHSLLFVVLFVAGILVQTRIAAFDFNLARMVFLYSGTLLIGFYAAFVRNRTEAETYLINKELKRKNSELNKYQLVLDQAPGSIFIIDSDLKFEYINPFFTRLTGYEAGELLHRNINDVIYKSGLPESRSDVAEALRKGYRWQGELLTYHKNGQTYWANTIAAPYKNESGNTEGYVIIQQDITERKNIELALRESEQLYRTLIEKSSDGIGLTQDGTILLTNQAFCTILGYTMDEMKHLTPENLIAPEDRERVFEQHYRKMRGELDTSSYLATFLHKSGRRLTMEMNSATVQIHGKNASLVTVRDITEQHALQKALELSESKYKTLVENSLDGIVIIRDDKILFANNTFCNMLGYSCNELYHMPSIEILHPNSRPEVRRIAEKRHNRDFSTISGVFILLDKNGGLRECETSSTLIEFEGQWASFFTVRDITESKRMRAELAEKEEKYRQLFEAESDAIFVVDTDSGEILDANPAAIAIYGYTYEALLQMKNTDVSAEPEKSFHATRNRETLVPIRFHKKKDGTVFPVELSAGFTTLGSRNIQIVTSRDITERMQIQEELSRSEKKYRELAELLPQTVYELNAQGYLTYMNKAGLNAFRIEGDYTTISAFDLIVAEDHARIIKSLEFERSLDAPAMDDKHPEAVEFTAKRMDGSTFPILLYGTQFIKNGLSVGSKGIIIDISERKEMENALRESESKYKTLIENSQDGIFAVIGDKIHFVNNTICKILGYSPEELYSMSAFDVIVPEDVNRGAEISQRRKMGDFSTVNDIFHFIAKDGSIKEAVVFSSVVELNGQIVSHITVHDLTETRRMQEQLRISEEKYRTVIEKATDGIVITQDGKLKFLNASMCDMLKYQQSEIIGMPFLDFVVEEDRQVMIDFHKRRMAGEEFTSLYRSHFIRKDGVVVTVELNARTSVYNGSPAAFIIIRDISDRIRIEQELQTAKQNLEMLNRDLEQRVLESSESLTEARTQLINLQKENLQSQFDVLKQQVNPHFLFNSLNVLTSLIKLEPDLAEKFSEHLSKVYRYVLENKDNELVDLNTELVFLDAYIFLLNIRFVDKLHVNINIPDATRNWQVIPLAMQLLIENAIKHNIMSKSNPLTIDIFVDKHNFLNIVNNLQERPSQIVSTGVGLKNIQNRYLLLNNTEPVFEKTETHFIAKVPLVKID